MKIDIFKYSMIALLVNAFFNGEVFSDDCQTVMVLNVGVAWAPYITYTPCGKTTTKTEDLPFFDDKEYSIARGTEIKLGPAGTWTVSLKYTPPRNIDNFNVQCYGYLASAKCDPEIGARPPKNTKQGPRIKK